MNAKAAARAGSGTAALILVRNACTHDARVLREARTLSQLGYSPTVLAVTSEEERSDRSITDGTPIVRLSPDSLFGLVRRRLRRRGGTAAVEQRSSDAALGRVASGGAGRRAPRALLRLHRWLQTLDYYRRAGRYVFDARPALLHCNDYNTMWVGVGARLLTRATVVYDAHELWPDRNLRPEPRWWLLACEFLFVRCAHVTITASPGYAEVMRRRYRIPAPTVIRNIPEASPAAGPREGNGAVATQASPLAVYVGALTRNRGLEVAIRALTRLPSLRLLLLGPSAGAYRLELARLARDEGVEARVEFMPPVPPSEVVDAVRGASIGLALIQPACLSYRMSLPNKLFEYVAAGLPVLASDLPVIAEFVSSNGVGLVARADDEDDVAEVTAEMLRPERNRAFREAARETAARTRWDQESRLLADAYGGPAEAAAR